MVRWLIGIGSLTLMLLAVGPACGQSEAARMQQRYQAFINVVNQQLPYLSIQDPASPDRQRAFRAYEAARQAWCTDMRGPINDSAIREAFGDEYQKYCLANPPPFHPRREERQGSTVAVWDETTACQIWQAYQDAEAAYAQAEDDPRLAWFWENSVRPDRRYQDTRPAVDQAVVRLYEAGEVRDQARAAMLMYEQRHTGPLNGQTLEQFCTQRPDPLEVAIFLNPSTPEPGEPLIVDSGVAPPGAVIATYAWQIDGQDLQGVNQPTWELADPPLGTHTLRLTVTDDRGQTATTETQFSVQSGGFSLTATADKATYITGEPITLHGRLSGGATAVMRVPVQMRITGPSGNVVTQGLGAVTSADGSFTVTYEVPKQQASPASRPETWEVSLSAQPSGAQGAARTTVNVQVAPVYIVLHDVRLVQVVEAPVIQGVRHVAAGRKGVLRVTLSCPTLKGVAGAAQPKVLVRFDAGIGSRDVMYYDTEVEVGPEETFVDLPFVLDEEGSYLIGAMVDHDFRYTRLEDSDRMFKGVGARVKRMKTLKTEFVPLYLTINTWPDKQAYLRFVREQAVFMKRVFPLPEQHFAFKAMTRLNPLAELTKWGISKTPGLRFRRYLLLKDLSLRSYLTADVVVGVLPSGASWWGAGEDGYSSWTFPPFAYYSRSVLVRQGAGEGVTAHEIGHTLGLNRYPWNEEYTRQPPFGHSVTGLLQIGDRAYDAQRDAAAAFGAGAGSLYCFMGNNPGWPMPSWVCRHTYPDLFKALMDPPVRVVYAAGVIRADGTVEMDPWYAGRVGEADPPGEGDFQIESVAANGEVLAQNSFGTAAEGDFAFGMVISYPEGTDAIRLRRGDAVLAVVRPSPTPPRVDALAAVPRGETIEVTWKGTDPDGDELAYSVLFSHDDGVSWLGLDLERAETRLAFDPVDLPGGARCRIKVVATDGFHATEAVTTESFALPDQPPVVFIDAPEDAATLASDAPVRLVATGFDAEDGLLLGEALAWRSSIQGSLGTGVKVASVLQPGLHDLTLQATDHDGQTTEASVTVLVDAPLAPPEGERGSSAMEAERQYSLGTGNELRHRLGHGVNEAGEPVGVTTLFDTDAAVHSWLYLPDARSGEQIHWTFTSPTGTPHAMTHTVEWEGAGSVYASLDLNTVEEPAEGMWQVSVRRGGTELVQEEFEVFAFGGFMPWGGLVGLGLAVAGIVLVVWLLSRLIRRMRRSS